MRLYGRGRRAPHGVGKAPRNVKSGASAAGTAPLDVS